MRRLLGGSLLAVVVLLAVSGPAGAATPAPAKLTGHGTVDGTLAVGERLTVKVQVQHTRGWQHIQTVDVLLTLRGSRLDDIQFTPTTSSLQIVGGNSGPASLGSAGHVRGAYFEIDPSRVALTAQGQNLRMTMPIKVIAAPPPGAQMQLEATAFPVAQLGPQALTKPVSSNSGFSWGTLGLAIVVALFAGGFFGNVFAARRKPAPRPSVYAAVERRMAEEKAKR